jgi:hypothetical protein
MCTVRIHAANIRDFLTIKFVNDHVLHDPSNRTDVGYPERRNVIGSIPGSGVFAKAEKPMRCLVIGSIPGSGVL